PKTLLADHVGVPTLLSLASYRYQTDGSFPGDGPNQVTTFLAENGTEYEIENTPSTLSGVGRDAISSSNVLQTVGNGYVAVGSYPDNSLGSGLELIAQIIHADVGARILYVTYGGFDNHSGEDQDHDPL